MTYAYNNVICMYMSWFRSSFQALIICQGEVDVKIEPAIKDLSKFTCQLMTAKRVLEKRHPQVMEMHALLAVKVTTSPELKEKVEEGSKILEKSEKLLKEANPLLAEANQKLYKGTSSTEFDEKVKLAHETLQTWMSTVYKYLKVLKSLTE